MIISFFAFVLVFVGILLTTNILPNKFSFGKSTGWALAALGMLILSVYAFTCGKIIFAIISLIFAIGNAYFSVDYFMDYCDKFPRDNKK